MKIIPERHSSSINQEATLSISNESMAGFFTAQIEGAAQRQRVELTDFTKSYVVKLLLDYGQSGTLHSGPESETLAMLYLRSQQASPEERIQILRRLGDVALCISGFFADSLNRKVVDVDYYIDMGGGAYGALASIFGRRRNAEVFSGLYDELGKKFGGLVEVLNDVSEGSSVQNQSMLRLYDRWMKTGSERIHRMLCEKGIVPSKNWMKTEQ